MVGATLDGRFETVSPLNHGSFGMVFLAKDITNGNQVAVKCLKKSSTTEACPEATINDHLLELSCHDRLGAHPNIVNLLHAFETDAHMYLVLEFCSMGDLYEAIRLGRGPLETEHVRSFMLQLVDAVEFMHSKGLFHRDIKPENIFLTQDGSMKLGDFGLSTTETWTYESSVGSDRYMAPEQYDPADNGYSPAQADIWAIGICLLNILFSKNPFVVPSESDVLFADYVRDKQSLFDVFPNMSQDTFEVLVHAMAIDPKKRSLSAIREALVRVLTFTTDEEILDEFCTEDREIVPASVNRQPLRTPSIQSPPVEQSGAFPWSKALHMSPPQTARQLSVIHDVENSSEEMFPPSRMDLNSWYPTPIDTASLASVLDSALGASVKSMNLRTPEPRNAPRSIPIPSADVTPVSTSLPVTQPKPVRAMTTVFGNSDNMVSKSWSDLWDEDEDDEIEDTRAPFSGLNWSQESIDNDPTVRASGFCEVPDRSSIESSSASSNGLAIQTPDSKTGLFRSLDGSEEQGSVFESIPAKNVYQIPTYSPPPKRSILDKWVALGNRRRAFNNQDKDNERSGNKESGRPKPKRTNSGATGLWRRGLGMRASPGNAVGGASSSGVGAGAGMGFGGGFWERKDKEKKDKVDTPTKSTGMGIGLGMGDRVKVKDWRHSENSSQRYHYGSTGGFSDYLHDDGDNFEMVGGWHDFQL